LFFLFASIRVHSRLIFRLFWLAEDLAKAGFIAYVMDVRGYGRSTRPKEMSDPPEQHAPLVRSNEAVRDIDAAVDGIRKRTGQELISLFGWATGGQWAGYYAALNSGKLSHVVIHLFGYRTAIVGCFIHQRSHSGHCFRARFLVAS
jgi:alpha-beta hydrolase superfamily lysophospholipase